MLEKSLGMHARYWLAEMRLTLVYEREHWLVVGRAKPGPPHNGQEVAAVVVTAETIESGLAAKRLDVAARWRRKAPHRRSVAAVYPRDLSQLTLAGVVELFELGVEAPRR